MGERGCAGEKRGEAQRKTGELCLVWEEGRTQDASLTAGAQFQKDVQPLSPVNGGKLGLGFEGGNLQKPSFQVLGPDGKSLEVQGKAAALKGLHWK